MKINKYINVKEFKSSLSKFADSTSFHGIKYIHDSPSLLAKFCWAVVLCSFLGFGLWSYSRSLNEYLERSTATSVKYLREKEILFPAVTICNLYYTQDINLKNYSSEKINFINNMTSPSFISNQVQSKQNLTLIEMSSVASRVYSSYLEKDKIGFEWKEMLMGCSFMDNGCENKDFDEVISPEFGRCYTSPQFVCKYEISNFLIKFFKEIILTLKFK